MSEPTTPQICDKVATIILAGGQGTRLHPLTLHRCKPGVCFGGRYRLIDIPISNSLNSNIHQIFVISQHFASGLQQHLSSAYSHQHFQRGHLEMLCPEQTSQGINWFLGTADAVRKNAEILKKCQADYFLILSGDQLYNIDLIKLIEFARNKEAELVVATLSVEEKEATRMGLLKVDEEGRIVDFIEKPKDPKILNNFCINGENKKKSYLGSMGIYVFKKEALFKLLEEEGNDFGADLIPFKIKQGHSFAFVYDGYWEDIGTIDSYYQANLALIENKNCLNMYDLWNPIYTTNENLPSPLIKNTHINNSLISQGCVIEAEEISNSLIGIKTQINKGSIIKDSILMGNHARYDAKDSLPYIGSNCLIQKTILDEDSTIGNNVILTNKNNLTHYDGDGIFIRDGIIIVSSGTKIPDGFVL